MTPRPTKVPAYKVWRSKNDVSTTKKKFRKSISNKSAASICLSKARKSPKIQTVSQKLLFQLAIAEICPDFTKNKKKLRGSNRMIELVKKSLYYTNNNKQT